MPTYRVKAGTEVRDHSGRLVATVTETFDMFNDRIGARHFVYADGSRPMPGTIMPAPVIEFLKCSLSRGRGNLEK